jgi:hypothetical protein
MTKAGATGLEPATSGVKGRRSNQLSYAPGRQATGARAGIISGSLDLEAEGSRVGAGRGDFEAQVGLAADREVELVERAEAAV